MKLIKRIIFSIKFILHILLIILKLWAACIALIICFIVWLFSGASYFNYWSDLMDNSTKGLENLINKQ